MNGIEVVRAGPHSTVQDLGRPGSAHLGVPAAGALDEFAVRLANRLVGNPDGAAAVECTLQGPALRFGSAGRAAVVGAPARLTVDGAEVPAGRVVDVPADAVLDVGRMRGGLRCWVAVAGGLGTGPVLGSRSVDTLTGVGGRPLADGDVLLLGDVAGPPRLAAAPDWPRPVGELTTVRTVAGPHADWFAERLLGPYEVTPRADRTGIRLAGAPLRRRQPGRQVASHGLVPGAVQVPPDGQPVVLLANHQTTGGYPVAGVVCAADLPLLAQLRPGSRLRFQPVRVDAARAAYAERCRALLGDPPIAGAPLMMIF